MAILVQAKRLESRFKSLTKIQRLFVHTHEMPSVASKSNMGSEPVDHKEITKTNPVASYSVDRSKWKTYKASSFGIKRSMVPQSPWIILNRLRHQGFDAYLVGGCVRDLLLKKSPKDYDIITTAGLQKIKEKFHRAMIVGQRFPICMVRIGGSVIEVSSFETVAQHAEIKEKALVSPMPTGCDEKDFIRWRNTMHRDFTVNSLFFDPFADRIYDYVDGLADVISLKLRTLIPAKLSFEEDFARILRGIRIAARLDLSISKDTEIAIQDLSVSVGGLAKSRIMLELNYMLSYGSAEASISLLQRFNLLEIFLPFHAACLSQQSNEKSTDSLMLMKLFYNLDKLVTCSQPCNCRLWVGLLAFHLALVMNPQDAFVVWTLASVLYHGKWKEGVKFAREHGIRHSKFAPEISGNSEMQSDQKLAMKVSQLASLVQGSIDALTESEKLLKLMSRYPDFPCSPLVFVPNKTAQDVGHIFGVLANDVEAFDSERESSVINYTLLRDGQYSEISFVLGKVILDTMNHSNGGEETKRINGERNLVLPKDIEETCNINLSDIVNDHVKGRRQYEKSKRQKLSQNRVASLLDVLYDKAPRDEKNSTEKKNGDVVVERSKKKKQDIDNAKEKTSGDLRLLSTLFR